MHSMPESRVVLFFSSITDVHPINPSKRRIYWKYFGCNMATAGVIVENDFILFVKDKYNVTLRLRYNNLTDIGSFLINLVTKF